jgi:hypothetical protein
LQIEIEMYGTKTNFPIKVHAKTNQSDICMHALENGNHGIALVSMCQVTEKAVALQLAISIRFCWSSPLDFRIASRI